MRLSYFPTGVVSETPPTTAIIKHGSCVHGLFMEASAFSFVQTKFQFKTHETEGVTKDIESQGDKTKSLTKGHSST